MSAPDIEFDFGNRYLKGGFGYHPEQMREWLALNTPFLTDGFGHTLLDVGCGDGFWSRLLRDFGWKVTGIDPCKEGIVMALIHAKTDQGEPIEYVPEDVFEGERGTFCTVFIRTFPFFNYPIDDDYRKRLAHVWAMAETQLVLIAYTKEPYGGRIPNSERMIYQNPEHIHAEVERLGGKIWRSTANNYHIWRVIRG